MDNARAKCLKRVDFDGVRVVDKRCVDTVFNEIALKYADLFILFGKSSGRDV